MIFLSVLTYAAGFSNGGIFHSSDNVTDSNDLHVFKNLETTDRDRDICGASKTYKEEEKGL